MKKELGEKRACNWVNFIQFINKELNRINEILDKNSNVFTIFSEIH